MSNTGIKMFCVPFQQIALPIQFNLTTKHYIIFCSATLKIYNRKKRKSFATENNFTEPL